MAVKRTNSAYIGLAKEVTEGTAVSVPTVFVPYDAGSFDTEDMIEYLRDETVRNNDSVLQGVYSGVKSGTVKFGGPLYPETLPVLYSAIVGIDTVTGSNPYTHTFAQTATPRPSWTLTDWEGVEPRQFPGATLSELEITVDSKGMVEYSASWVTWPSVAGGVTAYTNQVTDSYLGWAASLKIAGSAVTRLVSGKWTLSREVEPIHTVQASANPRTVFAGPLQLDGNLKLLYEARTDDYEAFLSNSQTAIQLDLASGSLTSSLRTTKGARVTGKKDRGKRYFQFELDFAGVHSTTDAGTLLATVVNAVATSYQAT